MGGARAACALALSLALSLLLVPTPSTAVTTGPTGSARAPAASHADISVAGTSLAAAEASSGLTLTRVSPVVAVPEEPVAVSGLLDVAALGLDLSQASARSATSAGSESLPSTAPAEEPVATVEVRLGSGDVDTHEDVEVWLSGTGPSQGRVVGSTEILPADDSAVERIPFSVNVGDLDERMREAYGVLPVSIEVWLPAAVEPAATVRTFVGYQVRKEYEPLRLTWVVPFTVPADGALVAEFGEERTAAWEALVGEEGSLRERLASASDATVVWAVDPDLLSGGPAPEPTGEDQGDPTGPTATDGPTPTAATTSGPQSPAEPTDSTTGSPEASPADATTGPVTSAPTQPGDVAPTTSDPEETDGVPAEDDPALLEHRMRVDFAAALLEAAGDREVLVLPQHDADVAALPAPTSEGRTPSAVRSLIDGSLDVDEARTLLTDAGATVTSTAWPADGGWSSSLDAALHELADRTAEPWSVLSSTTSLSDTPLGPFPSASGSTVLPYDALLSERASRTQDRSGALTSALVIMADSLVMLNERPGTTRHVIVALERDGPGADVSDDLTSVLADVPWLAPRALAEPAHDGTLVDQAPSATAATLLADSQARDLAATTSRLPVAASVRADGEADLATRGADTLAHLTSVRWRGHPQDWTTAYDPIGADVAETFTGLSIPSRDISFLADSGLLRVTVENALDTGIENATLDLTVEHPILRIESGPQPVEVGADSRSTVSFQATAIASGRVSVTATLRAPDGTVLGEPTQFSVRVSPTSDWIYWVLGGVALIVIAIGLGRTALRRRHNA